MDDVVSGQTVLDAPTVAAGLSTRALLAATASDPNAKDATTLGTPAESQRYDPVDAFFLACGSLDQCARKLVLGEASTTSAMFEYLVKSLWVVAVLREQVVDVLQATVQAMDGLEFEDESTTDVQDRGRILLGAFRPEMVPPAQGGQTLDLVASAVTALARTDGSEVQIPSWVQQMRDAWDAPGATSHLEECQPVGTPLSFAPLQEGRFPSSLLVQLAPTDVAQQIQAWHLSKLRGLWTAGDSTLDLGCVLDSSNRSTRLISFSPTDPHPLTALILAHVFEPKEPSDPNVTRTATDARHRATILRHWIAIASHLLK